MDAMKVDVQGIFGAMLGGCIAEGIPARELRAMVTEWADDPERWLKLEMMERAVMAGSFDGIFPTKKKTRARKKR